MRKWNPRRCWLAVMGMIVVMVVIGFTFIWYQRRIAYLEQMACDIHNIMLSKSMTGRKNLLDVKFSKDEYKTVANVMRQLLAEASDADVSVVITMLSNWADRKTGVDLFLRPEDQQLVIAATERHNRYLKKKGRDSYLNASIGDDGRLYVWPAIIVP